MVEGNEFLACKIFKSKVFVNVLSNGVWIRILNLRNEFSGTFYARRRQEEPLLVWHREYGPSSCLAYRKQRPFLLAPWQTSLYCQHLLIRRTRSWLPSYCWHACIPSVSIVCESRDEAVSIVNLVSCLKRT